MNIQALMKQAQKMQSDMTKEKEEINKTSYSASSAFVSVEVNGNKDLIKIKIDNDKIEGEDIEMLEDMIVLAVNDANKKVDNDIEKRMGKYTKNMPGLF